MKRLLKSILKRFDYELMTTKRLEKIIEGPYIPDLDFHYLLKDGIDKNEVFCCFDIGANVGQTSKKFHRYFPNAEIYAFEPVNKTFETLSQNVKEINEIKVYNVAMGDLEGSIEIFHRTNSEWNSLVDELNANAQIDGGTSEIVKVSTIDKFVKENNLTRVKILKSDTEGFELSVLEGGKNCLSDEKIDIIYVEVGFVKNDHQHTYWMDVVNYLEKFNYSFSGLFEISYGQNLKAYYANALFLSEKYLNSNQKKNNG